MISLAKHEEPQWLIDNKVQKTREYIDAPSDRKPSPWRNKEIVKVLKAETSRKCMYCESIIDDAGYSAVEHIRPKGRFPQEVLQWDNLGLICDRCNTNKSDYWTDNLDLQLLNPFVDDPSAHLNFCGPMTVAALESTRGRNTLRKLKFSERPDLLMSRLRKIEELDERLRLWRGEDDPEKKALFADDVTTAVAPNKEYSAVLTAFALAQGFIFP